MDQEEYNDLEEDVVETIESVFAEEENPDKERVVESVRATLMTFEPE